MRPTEGQLSDTTLFYRNAIEIYARFDEWKGIDRFYFIPLTLQIRKHVLLGHQRGPERSLFSCGEGKDASLEPIRGKGGGLQVSGRCYEA